MRLRKEHKKLRDIDLDYNGRDSRGRVCGKKGTFGSKIIAKGNNGVKEMYLHATKGFRVGKLTVDN